MSRLKAVVFDFDGVILDTEDAEFQAWSSVFSDFGVTLEMEEWSKCVGNAPGSWSAPEHLASLVSGVDTGAAERTYLGRRDAMIVEMDVRPGVRELIAELVAEGVPLAVASSSRHVWVDGLLRQVGLREEFPIIWTRDKAGRAKPWPDVYLKACEELGFSPARCVAIEDSPNGCLAAQEAGLKILGCPNEVTRWFFDASLCDRVVGSLGEVGVGDLRALVAG